MANRKIQYHADSKKIWQYIIGGESCKCGANVFHREYDGKDIFYVCNGCRNDFASLKDEFVAEELKKGIWK